MRNVYQIQQILLKATPSKSHGGLEEFGSDSGVHAYGLGDFRHVSTGRFAQRWNSIDAGNPLGQKRISSLQFSIQI